MAKVVNALPRLKSCSFWANPAIAKLSAQGLVPAPWTQGGSGWFSLFSEEPHWLIPNDLVGALGAIPAAWWRTSHDVLARLMFSSRADSFSPANRVHPHYQRTAPALYQDAPNVSRLVHYYHR